MKSLPFMVIFGDLILTGKFCCLNFFLLKNGIDKNFFYQHHLLYNQKYIHKKNREITHGFQIIIF